MADAAATDAPKALKEQAEAELSELSEVSEPDLGSGSTAAVTDASEQKEQAQSERQRLTGASLPAERKLHAEFWLTGSLADTDCEAALIVVELVQHRLGLNELQVRTHTAAAVQVA